MAYLPPAISSSLDSWKPRNVLRRLKARSRINREVGLWYHQDYVAPCLTPTGRLLEIRVDRGELVIGDLAHEGLIRKGDIRPSPLAAFEDLRMVHSAAYLESTTRPEVLVQIFGMDEAVISVDELLRAQRRAVGGTIDAALAVVQSDLKIGFNLGGGFHHAEPEIGGGYCVYNDVAVAISKLRGLGFVAPIAIIDVDYHEGNGNVVCFANDPSVMCYSVHGALWTHARAKAYQGVLLPPGSDDGRYLQCLNNTVGKMLERARPELVFYIAGNDVLRGDRLGEFQLSPRGVLTRDRTVLDAVRSCGAKLVVTMAGGYTSQAWRCTANFLRLVLTDDPDPPPVAEPELRKTFNRIARGFNWGLAEGGGKADPWAFTEEDIFAGLGAMSPSKRILGYYSEHAIELAMDKFGIFAKLRERGFSNLRMIADPSDPDRQVIRIFGRNEKALLSTDQILMELVVRRLCLPPPETMGIADSLKFIGVEWLRMEDPTARFTFRRPQLPGQERPGLGIGEHLQEFLVQGCQHLSLDGIHSRPSHYHNAAMAARWFRFLDPALEGRFLAMRHILAGYRLAKATEFVEKGRIQCDDGSPLLWCPSDQILPVSERLVKYFESPGYLDASVEVCNHLLGGGLQVIT